MPITIEFVGLIILIVGALGGLWFRIDASISKAKLASEAAVSLAHAETQKVADSLAAHRLHASETFQTKRESREAVTEVLIEVRAMRIDFKTMLESFDERMRHMEQIVAKAMSNGAKP